VKITLLRHTEVAEPYRGKYNGHNNIGLSKRGKEDAKRLAQKFANTPFERVYCSDLLRAKETLQPFVQAQDAIYTKALREKSWGRHEGMSFEQIEAEGIVYTNFTQWIEALDGECYHNYMQRLEHFFTQEIFHLECEHILMMTHSGVIRSFIAFMEQIPLEEAFQFPLLYGDGVVFDTKEQTFSPIK